VLLAAFLLEVVREGVPRNALYPGPSPAPGEYWDHLVNQHLTAGTEDLYGQELSAMEAEVIPRVLRHTNGNQVDACTILVVTMTALRSKLRQLGIEIARVVRGGLAEPAAEDGTPS
jgi:two-component system nitrogen regulation response regulator GlnG